MQIVLNNVHKHYLKRGHVTKAINGVSLQIEQGEMLSIMGKSGSGKSTLLNLIGGLDKLTDGSYSFEDKDIGSMSQEQLALFRKKNIGFVLQNFALINEKTVADNIELPLKYQRKISEAQRKNKRDELLQAIDLKDKEEKYPFELSGGEQQRVAIARALISSPKVILADEPTGALDLENETIVMNILKRINNNGTTIIIVTHDINIAHQCNRFITLSDGIIVG